ncbi:MAG: hypothetical protein BJ554DRAFT_7388, partial [Olpidium bornovanus]
GGASVRGSGDGSGGGVGEPRAGEGGAAAPLADGAAAAALPPRAHLRLPRPAPGAAVLAAGAAQETASSSVVRETGGVDRRATTTLGPPPVGAARRSTRRLWSEDEVTNLITAINSPEARLCESAEKWTTVASKVAGRSAQQCQRKAQYLLRTGKGSSLLPAWTPEEDAELWALAQALRNGRERAWTSAAARITGRSRKAVVGRTREGPEVRARVCREQDSGAAAAVKPRPWTAEEIAAVGAEFERRLVARVEAFDLRVPVPLLKHWTFDEDTILLSWANKSRMRDYNEIAYTLGRSKATPEGAEITTGKGLHFGWWFLFARRTQFPAVLISRLTCHVVDFEFGPQLSRLNGKNVSLSSAIAPLGGPKASKAARPAPAPTPVTANPAPEACDSAGVASGASGAIPEGRLRRFAPFGAGDANATGGLLLCKMIPEARFRQPPRRLFLSEEAVTTTALFVPSQRNGGHGWFVHCGIASTTVDNATDLNALGAYGSNPASAYNLKLYGE